MCTVIAAVDPGGEWDVLLAATRDEFRARAWDPPAAWWPEAQPGVVGGRDRRAGGTWLAVDAESRRAAVVLNRIEPSGVSEAEARSRGELPLLALAGGGEAIEAADLRLVRPFNLLLAEPGEVLWWRYDGAELSRHRVEPGLHIVTAADLDDMGNPRQRHWLPRFEAAAPPAPSRARRAPAGWGGWPELLADVDTPFDDPRALNVRHGGADGVFGTVSASLLALADDGLTFDFCPGPPDRAAWEPVL